MVLEVFMQILEIIGCFVFNVTGISEVRIGNRDRHWKAISERFLLTETRSACVKIQSSSFSM